MFEKKSCKSALFDAPMIDKHGKFPSRMTFKWTKHDKVPSRVYFRRQI